MSTANSFQFFTTKKSSEKPSLVNYISDRFSIHNELINKAMGLNGYANSRSSRPGISTLDYAPSYSNRMWLGHLYWLEDEVSILSDILQKMRDEILRYGFTWKPAFAKKCTVCGQDHVDDVEQCEICGSRLLREPDKYQLRYGKLDQYNTILDRANLNKQTLREVVKVALRHMFLTDNGFVLSHNDYRWGEDGSLRAVPREFFALDPRDVIKLFDFETGYPGKGRVCLDHRSSLLSETDLVCPTCGKPTFRAHYQVFTATKTSTYYIDEEICHMMFFNPGMIYGRSKLLQIEDELITYHMIEKRVRNYYEYCKVPGILFIKSGDPDSLEEMWQKIRDGTKDDPFTPAVLGVDDAPTMANFIRMMQDPNGELIAIKDDLRFRIASSFGITLAFTNDVGAGSSKADKNTISLSDRHIRSLQEYVDEKVLKWISHSLGITDWKLVCEPNINENKLEKEEIRAAQINNMERLANLNLKVVWKGDDYTVGKGQIMSPEMMMMNAGGGMQGPMMPPMDAAPALPPQGPPGVPMMPNELGGMSMSPEMPGMPPQDTSVLDAMAAGKAPGMEQPLEDDDSDKLTESLKQAFGIGIPKKSVKRKSSTRLSRILDEMFMSNEERSSMLDEDDDAGQQDMSMPDMGMDDMSSMGPAPMGLGGASMDTAQQPPIPPMM